ncbi:hypothetical protein [Hydrogenoanaerobacterium sp.]|uniref:hypothetical protein n=1 Tax=Hydrogenoanaerobacterium sp. TaxID=2953763 RepID=UPI002899BD60|nr:hypothetical protein [Hydrogenoanaerobacterium sp.]
MKRYKNKNKKGLAKWLMILSIVSTLVTIVTILISRILEQRMMLKITQCMDSLQKALPTIEKASQIYINANTADEIVAVQKNS